MYSANYVPFFVGDAAAASYLTEQQVNDRVQLFLDMEDPEIVIDLRSHNSGQKSQYDVFWDEVKKFLQEDVGLAAEERRHSEVTHLARVISVRDLLEQVAARCPPGIVLNYMILSEMYFITYQLINLDDVSCGLPYHPCRDQDSL